MAETDLATWLTIEDAAAQIGCSTRTVERLGKAKQLEQRLRRQEGTPPVAVFNPDDVARVASARRPAATPFVLGAVPGNGNGHGHQGAGVTDALVTSRTGDDPIARFFALMVSHLQSPPSPPVSASRGGERTAYVSKAEALALSGISARELRKAVQAGEVKQRGRTYRLTDLEAL